MKKLKLNNTLRLNKEIITKLNKEEMIQVKGGGKGGSDRLCTNTPCATNGCNFPTKK